MCVSVCSCVCDSVMAMHMCVCVFTFCQVLFEFPELLIKNMQQWTGRPGGLPGPRWSQDLQQAVCVFWKLLLVTSVVG